MSAEVPCGLACKWAVFSEQRTRCLGWRSHCPRAPPADPGIPRASSHTCTHDCAHTHTLHFPHRHTGPQASHTPALGWIGVVAQHHALPPPARGLEGLSPERVAGLAGRAWVAPTHQPLDHTHSHLHQPNPGHLSVPSLAQAPSPIDPQGLAGSLLAPLWG